MIVYAPSKRPVLSSPGRWGRGGVVLPYMGYIGMCRCEGYGFQTVYSRIGYISERLGLEWGITFQETDQLVEDFI